MKELIKKLVEAWGPTGFEHHIRALIEAEVKSLCDEMSVDPLGNLICKVGKKTKTSKRVMIAAHMDEIGLMVSHIDKRGYLRFTNLGGLFPTTLVGNRVKFEDGTIGTIQMEDFWTSDKAPDLNRFFIDISIGVNADGTNKNPSGIEMGSPAIFWRNFEERGDRLISKSMDDRIGCAVAIETMRKLKKSGCEHEAYFVFTTQEENGTRGAKASAYSVDAELGIALDVTVAGDDLKNHMSKVGLGKGTAIKMIDKSLVTHPKVRDLMINTAEKHKIPYQREVLLAGGTDAGAIHTTRGGIPSGCISIPCRYVHTVSETVDVNDVQASIDLLAAILSNPIGDLVL